MWPSRYSFLYCSRSRKDRQRQHTIFFVVVAFILFVFIVSSFHGIALFEWSGTNVSINSIWFDPNLIEYDGSISNRLTICMGNWNVPRWGGGGGYYGMYCNILIVTVIRRYCQCYVINWSCCCSQLLLLLL